MEKFMTQSVQGGPDQEEEIDLRRYWQILTRYKWGILGLALAITVLATLVVFTVSPVYRATTTLLIQEDQSRVVTNIQDFYDSGNVNSKEYLQTQFEILKSRELAVRVIDGLNLQQYPDFSPVSGNDDDKAGFDWHSWLPKGHAQNPLSTDEERQSRVVDKFQKSLIIEPVRNTQLVKISFESHDAKLAAKVANALAQAYIDSDMEARVAMTEQAAGWLTQRLGTLKTTLDESEQKLQDYREKNDIVDTSGDSQGDGGILALNAKQLEDLTERLIDAQFKLSQISQRYGPKHPEYQQAQLDLAEAEQALKSARENAMKVVRQEFGLQELLREVETNRNLYDTFFTRIKEANQTRELQTPNARIVDPAVTPDAAARPMKGLTMGLSFVLSIMLGVMLAFLLDYLDSTFKGAEDVEARLGVPMLGLLPIVKGQKSEGVAQPLFLESDQQSFSEAMRTIRTGVVLSGLDSPNKIVVVTSSVPGEGKTTTSLNLALAMGQMEKVLLIDADMRRPSIAKAFGIPVSSPGLSNLVAGTADTETCLHRHAEGNIDILPAGLVPPNPLELLSSKRFQDFLDQLAKQYDRIVIDSAPTLAVSDAIVLSTLANAVIYVVKSDSTAFHSARSGIQKLQRVHAPLTGVVLNQVNLTKASKYGSYYGYYDYYGYKSSRSE